MASIFDYLYTCSSCEEQYVSEGRGEVYYEYTPTLEMDLEKRPVENESEKLWKSEVY